MSKINVLVEVMQQQSEAFSFHASMVDSQNDSVNEAEKLLSHLSGYGLDVLDDIAPVPIFGKKRTDYEDLGLTSFGDSAINNDVDSSSVVISCQVDQSKLEDLESNKDIQVWPNSPLTLLGQRAWGLPVNTEFEPDHLFDMANSASGLDCRPFRSGVSVSTIRELLGVDAVWSQGFRGQNIVVGIIDEGVNGDVYPVIGGFSQ